METTEFKVFMVLFIIVLIALAIELPVRIIKRFQKKQIVTVNVDLNKLFEDVKTHPEPQYTEQDFWYPPEVKPIRDGVYRVRWVGLSGTPILHFAYWRHGAWGVIAHTIEDAEQIKGGRNCVCQDFSMERSNV